MEKAIQQRRKGEGPKGARWCEGEGKGDPLGLPRHREKKGLWGGGGETARSKTPTQPQGDEPWGIRRRF